MRNLLITLLLASVAGAPAISTPTDGSSLNAAHHEARSQHSSHSNAPMRSARQHVERSSATHAVLVHPPLGSATKPLTGGAVVSPPPQNDQRRIETIRRGPTIAIPQTAQPTHGAVLQHRTPGSPLAQRPIVSPVARPGTEPPLRTEPRPTPKPQWNTNWRGDRHYDWRNWRHHHRSWFHLGFYIDPFGWGYFPYEIGWRLWPAYYGSSYWIDHAYYDLPPAPPGTQWVRYYNDAVLVDVWTGEVIDVIHDFFW